MLMFAFTGVIIDREKTAASVAVAMRDCAIVPDRQPSCFRHRVKVCGKLTSWKTAGGGGVSDVMADDTALFRSDSRRRVRAVEHSSVAGIPGDG